MVDDLWSLFGLMGETPQMGLRLPRDEDLAARARVAAAKVDEPHEQSFPIPWAEACPEARARFVPQQRSLGPVEGTMPRS